MLLLKDIILAGGQYLPIKASLHLVHESILFLGKDSNQSLALPLNEKGNTFNLIISPSTSLYFCISQSSTKLLRWAAASSELTPENCSLITRFSKAGLISKNSAVVAGGAIGVHRKSLLFAFVKSHNLVFSGVFILATVNKTKLATNFFVFCLGAANKVVNKIKQDKNKVKRLRSGDSPCSVS